MDRLVTVDQKELTIPFKPHQRCSSQTFRITNLMHTMSVAISITTSPPSIFSFKPSNTLTIIPPLSSLSFSLLLSEDPSPPSSSSSAASLTLLSSMLPTGKADSDVLRRLFATPGRHIFKDAVLPIFLVGPQVVESLLSATTLESSVLLDRAAAACSPPQISALLRSAARAGKPHFVSALISAGGDVNARESNGASPLALAVASGNPEVIRVLVDSGSEFDPAVDRFLHEAAEANRVDLIAAISESYGRDCLNQGDSHGRTPIHSAAARGHVGVIQFCLSVGADPGRTDSEGWTPLHCAAADGRLEAVEFLLNCAPYTKYALTKNGQTPFSLAIDGGHFHLLDPLRLGDALHRAAGLDDVHGIKNCLARGAKVNGRDQNGWTALHRAAFKGRIESVKLLLSHGAQVDLVDDAGYTPLHCAIEAGHTQVVLHLLSHGAPLNPKSMIGICPLDLALYANHPTAVVPLCNENQQA